MLGKILLAAGAFLLVMIIFLVGLSVLSGGGGYPVGPIADGTGIKLLCKKKKTAVASTAKYTATEDSKVTDVQRNLQASLDKIHGDETYIVNSPELLGLNTPTPGSLVFKYECS